MSALPSPTRRRAAGFACVVDSHDSTRANTSALGFARGNSQVKAVSYTHLTLPTIYSV